jgi:hypothetical protein
LHCLTDHPCACMCYLQKGLLLEPNNQALKDGLAAAEAAKEVRLLIYTGCYDITPTDEMALLCAACHYAVQ